MAKGIKIIALISALLTVLFVALYMAFPLPALLSLAITAGTIFYHFAMRLAVGSIVDAIMHNRANAERAYFRTRAWEKKLYSRLGVRKWRGKMPTYNPSLFSTEIHTYTEILGANCQAEVVHEVIMLLSFLPIATIPVFGSPAVFIVTSTLAAAYDSLFVIMQRAARPHLVRAACYAEKRNKESDHVQSRPV